MGSETFLGEEKALVNALFVSVVFIWRLLFLVNYLDGLNVPTCSFRVGLRKNTWLSGPSKAE